MDPQVLDHMPPTHVLYLGLLFANSYIMWDLSKDQWLKRFEKMTKRWLRVQTTRTICYGTLSLTTQTICYGTAASGWMPCYGLWKWNLKMNIKRRDGESFPLCHQMSWNMKTSVGKNKMTCCCLTEKGVGLKIISRTWNCMMSLMIWSWKQKLSVFRIEGSPHCWENYANSPKMLLNNL